MRAEQANTHWAGAGRGAVLGLLALLAGLALSGFWIAERLSRTPDSQTALSSQEVLAEAEEAVDDAGPLPPPPETQAPVGTQAPVEVDASRTELESGLATTDGLVHGRVVSDAGDAFPGLRVTLASLFEDLASTRTDSEGCFKIPNPERGSRRLSVELPDEWSCERNPRKLTRDEREGRDAIEIALFPRRSDPVRGRLTNSGNDLGVPGYPLRIVAGERQEDVVTDATGHFTTSTSFEHGTVSWNRLKSVESPSHGVRIFEGLHTGAQISFEIEVGPTYRLLLSPSEALSDDLMACVIEPDNSSWDNERGWYDAWDSFSGRGRASLPVTGLDTVLRFPKNEQTKDCSRLIVFSMTTGWFASLTVPTGAQVHTEPVRAVLERQSVLTVDVVSSIATTHAFVTVSDDQGQERTITPQSPVIVRPGTYELSTAEPRHDSHRGSVSLAPGPTTHRVALTPANIGGRIAGTVRTRSGESPQVFVALKSTDRNRALLSSQVDWKKGVGSFEVPDVPTGTYQLELMSDTVFEWSPSSLLVEPPRTNLEFTLLDDTETCPWDIEVTAADTGNRLRPDVRVHVAGVRQPFEAGPRPVDAEFEYTILAADYQLYRGDQTDFERTLVDGEPQRIARIALQPGWRIYVDVQDEQGRALEGAELIIEDEVVAATDSNGYADVSRAGMPDRLVVRKAGFVEQPVSPYSGEGLVQLARE